MMRCPAPTITRRAVCTGLLVLLVLLQGGRPTAAQDVPDAGVLLPGDTYLDASRGKPPVPEAPPELPNHRQAALERTIKKLTTPKDSVRAKVEEEILEYGRGAIPALVEGAETTHEGRQDSIVRCLVELADARDRLLVEDLLGSENVTLRRFAAASAGRIGTQRLVDGLRPLLRDRDPRVAFEAALSMAANRREDGLEQLVLAFDDTTRERILASLSGLAGGGSHAAIVDRLRVDEQRMRIEPEAANAERRAAVAMLGAIGDDAALDGLARALDDPNSLVQLDAIDAVRRLVEQKEPFGAASIFAQIKEVERLKEVLRTRPR